MLADVRKGIDLSRWAVVSYKDDSGLGRMAEDARRVLGMGRHFAASSKRLQTKALVTGDFPLKEDDSDSEVETLLADMQGVLLLERPDWHPNLLRLARKQGVFTAAVVMWEWFDGRNPLWRHCDLFICPNRMALNTVRGYGFENAMLLPWAIDLNLLPKRLISGPARTFIHNAGLIDNDDRKGTRDVIEAFSIVLGGHLRLIVRSQKPLPFAVSDSRVEVRIGNTPSVADLYNEGEAAVQPSKMEGIGFMVLEPICAGLPTITLNAAPMREYAAVPEMLVKTRWFARRAFASQWIPQASLRLPSIADLAAKICWCTQNDLAPISTRNRSWAESEYRRERIQEEWAQALEARFV